MAQQFAYDFSAYNNGSTAPSYIPERKTKQQSEQKPELRRLKRKAEDVRKSELASAKVIAKFFAAVAFAVVLFSIVCNSFAAVKSSKYQQIKYQAQRDLQQNNYLEKCAELNALVTPDEIARTAVEKLGMIKVSDENKLYASASSENEILFSADK